MSGYTIVESDLPALGIDDRILHRVAAVDPDVEGDNTLAAIIGAWSDGTWTVSAGFLSEEKTRVLDSAPLRANSEKTARAWLDLIARLYTGETA